MTVSASTRIYLRRLSIVALMGTGALLGVSSICGAASGDETSAGTWQAHRYQFQYLSYNSTYSCSGLADRLRLLLRTVDARDVHVTPVCLGNPGLPDRFATADLRFQILMPESSGAAAASATSTPGAWQHVVWTFEQPRTLGPGDCSLIQQLLKTVVPMLPTRNLQTHFDCAQNHDYGSFHVNFDVFAPTEAAKQP